MSTKKILQNLLNNGSFFGHKIGKNLGTQGIHPSMSFFLLGNRKNIPIIDINATIKGIIKTLYIIFLVINQKGHVLIVNTNPEISHLIEYFVLKTQYFKKHFSYCNNKWVGGTLTNWKHITNSIVTYMSFSKRFGPFIIRNNIHFPGFRKLEKSFRGFKNQNSILTNSHFLNPKKKYSLKSRLNLKKPDILFVINPNENKNVINEAKNLNIPVIALTDTNTDLSLITYPIPVNTYSPFFIKYYFSWISRILKSKYSKAR